LELVHDLALHIAALMPPDIEALLAQAFVKDPMRTVQNVLAEASSTLREQLEITRFVRWDQRPLSEPQSPTPPRSPALSLPIRST
jgi:hypothetical protein